MLTAPSTPKRSLAAIALLLAVVMNAANLLEPVAVDDVCHHYYAAQVAAAPTAPYEFEPVWHQKPVPGWTIMVAPVHSYYWAPGIWLFGDSVVGWHLWFLPVQWLFCYSLLSLLHRWLRRGAVAITTAIALGPAVLPGLNLMLEIPMLALGLTSLVWLQRAFDRRAIAPAIVAGVFWGLAFQTKYSAMALFPPWFLLALLRWRWREWAAGFAATVAMVLAVEGLLSLSHGGGSYFLQQLSYTQTREWDHLFKGMFQQVGVLAMPGALLALVGLGARRGVVIAVAMVYVVGLAIVGLLPDDGTRTLADGAPDSIAYVTMSAVTWLVVGATLGLYLRSGLRGLPGWRQPGWRLSAGRAMRLFLVLWCLCEIVSSFVVSPFPAARRVLMVVVAFTVAGGWLAVRRAGTAAAVRTIAFGAALLGAFVQAVDYVEGHAWIDAAESTAAYARERHPGARVYFTGGWGFEFYAPRAGLAPLLEDRVQLEAGDLVALGSIDGIETEWFEPDPRLELIEELPFGVDALPFSTQFCYYSGQRPLDGQVGPRFVVRILRATERLHTRDLATIPDHWESRGEQK